MKSNRANGMTMEGRSGGSKRRRGQGGTAALEMALVMPLLGGVVMGFVDLGRAYELHTRLTNAAHEGAAFARYKPSQVDGVGRCTDPDNIVFATRHEQGTSSPFTVSVSYTTQAGDHPTATWIPITGCGAQVPAARVAVKASAPFRPLTPLVAALVGSSNTLDASSEVVAQ